MVLEDDKLNAKVNASHVTQRLESWVFVPLEAYVHTKPFIPLFIESLFILASQIWEPKISQLANGQQNQWHTQNMVLHTAMKRSRNPSFISFLLTVVLGNQT